MRAKLKAEQEGGRWEDYYPTRDHLRGPNDQVVTEADPTMLKRLLIVGVGTLVFLAGCAWAGWHLVQAVTQ